MSKRLEDVTLEDVEQWPESDINIKEVAAAFVKLRGPVDVRPAEDDDDTRPQRLVAIVRRVFGWRRFLWRVLVLGFHPVDLHVRAERNGADDELGAIVGAELEDRRTDPEHTESVDLHPGSDGTEVVPGLMDDDECAQRQDRDEDVHQLAFRL